jgi:hypothetical protein
MRASGYFEVYAARRRPTARKARKPAYGVPGSTLGVAELAGEPTAQHVHLLHPDGELARPVFMNWRIRVVRQRRHHVQRTRHGGGEAGERWSPSKRPRQTQQVYEAFNSRRQFRHWRWPF